MLQEQSKVFQQVVEKLAETHEDVRLMMQIVANVPFV